MSFEPGFNDFGQTGLLQMPSGRMAPDGEMVFGSSYTDPYTRIFLTVQFLPWLQGTFRYTDIANVLYGPRELSGDQTYKDKGVDLKLRLVEEGPYLPEISVGFRDIGGTSLFGSEYIAASRRYYDFDFTLGMAWGNAGTRGHIRNPLTYLSDRFGNRTGEASTISETGTLGLGSFFSGPRAAFFGGIEWHTPVEGLRLMAEYDGNNYQEEAHGNQFPVSSPLNFGASYRALRWLDLSLAYERGNEVMLRGMLRTNFNSDMGVPNINEKPPLPVTPRRRERPAEPSSFGVDQRGIAMATERVYAAIESEGLGVQSLEVSPPVARLHLVPTASPASAGQYARAALAVARLPDAGGVEEVIVLSGEQEMGRFDTAELIQAAGLGGLQVPEGTAEKDVATVASEIFGILNYYGFKGERFAIEGQTATLVYSQGLYANLAKAAGRAARVLAAQAPEYVEELRLIEVNDNLPISQITLLRTDVEKAANYEGSADETWLRTNIEAPSIPDGQDWVMPANRYPDLQWGLSPQLRQTIGGPDGFYLYQIYGALDSSLTLAPGLNIQGRVAADIVNNFDRLQYQAPSGLPRVRTDLNEYLKDSAFWIDSLTANYLFQIAPEWYGRASAGLFEMMYGGVGGEVLYRPHQARWALGLDLNHVVQRDFDGLLGFKDYQVTTGHLTYYHQLPFYDLFTSVSAGRYLAGDVGATLQVGREFANGVTVGAWATKTDVSAEQFGEGAFDKGFYINIPFDLFSTTPSKGRVGFAFAPLTRDGGAKVAIPRPLYGEVTSSGRVEQDGWREMWK
ncbi:YjbH domain-containing protein [Telmatospirillum sp. J64-1]|uniref:YjbH domain-containing protein n=1 Tax=Telmatospirillum sp. J64-1 TaxID=2502183 RepID=UPI00163D52DA|nr:YjbH domain-containing protein [Telmatospirillum sp. J64-1]